MQDTIILRDFAGDALLAPDAEEIKQAALVSAARITAVKSESDLRLAVAEMRSLKEIFNPVIKIGKALRDPVKALANKIKLIEDTYILELKQQHDRIQGMSNHFQDKQHEEQRRMEIEAERERQKAQHAAQEAARLEMEAERLREAGKNKKAAQIEERALEMALEAEEKAIAVAPVAEIKVAGYSVRERINYQVVQPGLFFAAHPRFWKWDADTETLKVKRQELLDVLGVEGETSLFQMRDKEGLPVIVGLRVYREVKGHTR